MGFTYPLARSAFFDLLRVQEASLDPGGQVAASGLGGGEILTSEAAPPLWQGSVNLAPMRDRAASGLLALLNALETPGASFYAGKANEIGPDADPDAAALAAATVTLAAVSIGTGQLSLAGLPAGFAIAPGDLLSFGYGAPTRRAMHRAMTAATADGAGTTPLFDVFPAIRPGAAASAGVDLVRPYFKAVIVPGSVSYGATARGIRSGVAFSYRQSLR